MAAKTKIYKGFDLLSRSVSFAQSVQEVLASKAAQKDGGKPAVHGQMPSLTKPFIRLPDLALAYLFQMRGLLAQRLLSIIGPDRVGKTSLAFTMAGWAMQYNSPVYYLETESKFMLPDRIRRCLHTNPTIAERMYRAINFEQAFTIKNAVERLENWVELVRRPNNAETYVPWDIPLLVIIDSLSKLMPPKEAQGRAEYPGADPGSSTAKDRKVRAKAEKQQDLDEGSTQEFSKMMHKWSRRLPDFLRKHNVLLILIEHQNQEVNMRGGSSSFIPQIYADLENRTKIGGNAMNQNATYQVVMAPYKQDTMLIRGKPEVVGRFCRMKMVKNSAAAGDKTIGYRLQIKALHDTETYREPVLNFDLDLGDLLQQSQVLDIRPGRTGTWSCREFGGQDLEPRELARHYYARTELHEAVFKGLYLGGEGEEYRSQTINPAIASPLASTAEAEPEEDAEPVRPTRPARKSTAAVTAPPAEIKVPLTETPVVEPPAQVLSPTDKPVSKMTETPANKPASGSKTRKALTKPAATKPAATKPAKPKPAKKTAPAIAPAAAPALRQPKPPLGPDGKPVHLASASSRLPVPGPKPALSSLRNY